MEKFREDLRILINQYSKENCSGTPDFMLADYLVDCLDAFEKVIARRLEWHNPTNDESYKDYIK